MEKCNLKWWLSAGTVLGAYRDKDFIPHDTDIDVGVEFNDNEDGVHQDSRLLMKYFSDLGFDLCVSIYFQDKPMQLAFSDRLNDVVFDIYFFYSKHDRDYAYNANMEGEIKKPYKYLKRLKELEFNGKEFPIPNHIKEYLKYRYGDWQTPAQRKTNWASEHPSLERW